MCKGLQLAERQTMLRALDLYAAYNIDFEDALIVAQMERQSISELYSYDRGFDKVAGISRREP
jgi:predicted nucleic acid-binding protein